MQKLEPNFSEGRMAVFLTSGLSEYKKDKLKQQIKDGSSNNRIYGEYLKAQGFHGTYFTKPLMYAGQPYYCPSGWRRYGLDVGVSKEQFAKKYDDWPVCYHGTSSQSASAIIMNGFKSSNNSACWIQANEKAVFLTPSIVYAGHPRYAKIIKHEGLYIQIVLQMRVKKGTFKKMPGTVENTFVKSDTKVDHNYENKELEWVFIWNQNREVRAPDGILVYGIFAKITRSNPRFLPGNEWWEDSRERLKWDSYEH